MTTYEEFIKPYLKPKDEYEHIIAIRHTSDLFGNPNNPKNYVDALTTDKFDEIFINMQKDNYEIVDFQPVVYGCTHNILLQ